MLRAIVHSLVGTGYITPIQIRAYTELETSSLQKDTGRDTAQYFCGRGRLNLDAEPDLYPLRP